MSNDIGNIIIIALVIISIHGWNLGAIIME